MYETRYILNDCVELYSNRSITQTLFINNKLGTSVLLTFFIHLEVQRVYFEKTS